MDKKDDGQYLVARDKSVEVYSPTPFDLKTLILAEN